MKVSSILALGIVCSIGLIDTAAAKSTSQLPGVCSQSSIGKAYFLKQGSKFGLGFSVNGGVNTMGIWHTTIKDNGSAVLLDYTTDVEQQGVSIHTQGITLGKGAHSLVYKSENLNSGEICSALVVTKV